MREREVWGNLQEAQHRRAEDEREKRVHLQPGDQQDDGGNAEDGGEDQPGRIARGGRCSSEQGHAEGSRGPGIGMPRSRLSAASSSSTTTSGGSTPETVMPGSSDCSGSSVASWLSSSEGGM